MLALLAACTEHAPAASSTQRLVSLSPAITEVLFWIGAGDQVVGVSDYSDFPPEVRSRPRAGTMLAPAYEAIAAVRPTRIVGERVLQSPEQALSKLAPTSTLPWLTLSEVAASTRALGQLAGHQERAEELARRFEQTLSQRAPPGAPHILLVIGYTPELSTVWYVKPDSLHGMALEAAGGRNAVEGVASGPPNLSLEKIVEIDPDGVIVLVSAELDEPARQSYLDGWNRLSTLKAVRRGAIRIVANKGVQSTGPRIFELVDRLHAEIASLPSAP
jgi:iron complex transport system substrate-binding protein